LSLLAENIPVIVLQNNAIALFPQWHYAVVIGYDLDSAELILHTGVTEAHRLIFSTFERTWQRAQYWMLAMLPSDKTSKHLDPFIYAKACQDLISTQQSSAGVAALKTATQQWPDYWLPYFLLGNYYFSTQPLAAANWFAKGLPFAQQEVSYLNNYAMLLSELGCDIKAKELIAQALNIVPDDSNLQDSENQILLKATYRGAQQQGPKCRLP
jgi:tetratricopeptide (TPR) repeat protein